MTPYQIDIVSVVPELLDGPFSHSIIKRAQDRGLLSVNVIDLREFGLGKHRKLDDYQYGGGAGMVMMIEPLVHCLNHLQAPIADGGLGRQYDEIIFLTPDGEPLKQATVNELSLLSNVLLVCGHYKGIDERFRTHYITREISIGDYVLSGGEIAAAVLTDAIGRLIPGVLNDETSALSDSFQDGLLSPPVYTRPVEYNGWQVPDILLSGNHRKIDDWRTDQAVKRTSARRPDLLDEK